MNTRRHAGPSLRAPVSNMATKGVDRAVRLNIGIWRSPVGVIAAGSRNGQLRRTRTAAGRDVLGGATVLVERPMGRRFRVGAVKNPLALRGRRRVFNRHWQLEGPRDSTPRGGRRTGAVRRRAAGTAAQRVAHNAPRTRDSSRPEPKTAQSARLSREITNLPARGMARCAHEAARAIARTSVRVEVSHSWEGQGRSQVNRGHQSVGREAGAGRSLDEQRPALPLARAEGTL